MLNIAVLLFFPGLMAYAAASDLLTMRISNRIILALIVGFVVLALVIQMPLQQFGMHLAAAAIVLVVAFACFSFGWIGGGDAKLAAVTTLWLGLSLSLPYLINAAIFGGALTLAILMLRHYALPAQLAGIDWIARLHDKSSGVPYGIALAAAGLLNYSDSIVFLHFAT